jgi:hypothetical protein
MPQNPILLWKTCNYQVHLVTPIEHLLKFRALEKINHPIPRTMTISFYVAVRLL